VTESGTGGAVGTGGKTGTGGVTGTGGKTGAGGVIGTGGSTVPTAVDCTDTSSFSNLVTGQYGASQITVDNNSNKTYYMQANWWGTPYNNQTENINGIGFTMNNPNNASSSNSTPIGYPSIYIGSYQCRATKGSNLPKQISSLTSVPTIFSTNADSKGWSNYVADYDVWLTQSGSTLGCSAGDPGAGGAFLMVWLFKPTDRQPRGSIIASGRDVSGLSGSWTVWMDSSNSPRPCVSYVSDTKLASLEFDLNDFIQDAVKNSYVGINANQYLNIIFAGFEVWGGGDGLKINKFCANVK
jgi:cellulose 1,4-beta-cellobiosidase